MATEIRKRLSGDAELEQYRAILDEPTEFKNGFTWVAVAGAFFCGLLMMPGTIYLSLMTGGGIAASWVTLIIFSEVTRRAMKTLSKQELVVLLGVASTMSMGGPIGDLIWRQYLIRSDAVRDMGLLGQFPSWYAPQPASEAILSRSLLHSDWMIPILLMVFLSVIGTLRSYTLGYFFFRLTSDIERLPFPFAAVGAQGTMALAEAGEKQTTWKWRVFSLGAVLGLSFAVIQLGVPLVTGAFLTKPILVIPLPWYDATTLTENLLPATPFGLVIDLGLLLTGMIVPFWAAMGTGAGILLTTIMNPLLHKLGVLQRWQPGMDTINTTFNNSIDFWWSFSIGVTLAIAVISFYQTFRDIARKARERRRPDPGCAGGDAEASPDRKALSAGAKRENLWAAPDNRGDFSPWLAVALYCLGSGAVVWIAHLLVPKFPLYFLILFTMVYAPIMTYIDARLQGICGQEANIPLVKEMAIILSGYKGIDIWLAPIPLNMSAGAASHFRTIELTGTNFFSYVKSSALTMPLGFILSFIFWAFIWKSGAVPSDLFPYAQKMWELTAKNTVLLYSATMETGGAQPLFFQALHPKVIAGSFSFTVLAFIVMSIINAPIMAIYGFLQSIGGMPHGFILLVVGNLIGKFYFRKRFGTTRFLQIAPVLLAGYGTGVGLIALIGVAINLIVSAVSGMPF
ncbi:MAG: peptide transporter [Lentisphaerae bacterium]|nr:peptide transporter [Lentisphaerota bacterium]